MYIYIYIDVQIYTYIYKYMCVHIYIYIGLTQSRSGSQGPEHRAPSFLCRLFRRFFCPSHFIYSFVPLCEHSMQSSSIYHLVGVGGVLLAQGDTIGGLCPQRSFLDIVGAHAPVSVVFLALDCGADRRLRAGLFAIWFGVSL